jgi:hypothetical protein
MLTLAPEQGGNFEGSMSLTGTLVPVDTGVGCLEGTDGARYYVNGATPSILRNLGDGSGGTSMGRACAI